MPVSRRRSARFFAALLSGVSLIAMGADAFATVAPATLPAGGNVAGGSATISQQGADLTVNQASQKAIINWQSFDVGSQAQVTFNQPDSAAIALNRVLSATPSTIDGKIVANGQVWLINPAGVVFGAGAVANVGGLVASTMNITDGNFMSGNNVFTRDGSTGSIVNEGTLKANPGGMIALLAPELRNEGTISAQLGTVVMAAGEQVVLNIDTASGSVLVQVDPAVIHTMIENRSIVVADGGTVILSAKAADALIGSTINNSGVIEAASLTSNGGSIELSGATDIENTGTLDASGLSGGTIKVAADQTAGQATVGGNVKAAGSKGAGGTATVTGNRVLIGEGAHIDATGTTGGGTINAGGSWEAEDASIPESTGTVVAPTAVLDASATVKGDGGTVVARSDIGNPNSVTRAYGTFLAAGGPQGGNGGRIETSGHFLDTEGAQGGAASLFGKSGVWLFDPYDVTISSASNANGTFSVADPSVWTPNATGSIIQASAIQAKLEAGTSVTVTTAGGGSDKGNIIVNNEIDKTTGNTDVTLTLSANTDIHLNAGIIDSGGTGKLNVQLNADNTHSGTGIIYLNGDITTRGGDLTFGDGTTINLNGNTTYVSGDVYMADTIAHALDTGGGAFTLNGQLIIKDASGLTVSTGGGNVNFKDVVDSGDDYALISAPGTTWTTDFNAAKSGTGGGVGDTYMVTVTSHLEGEIVALTTIVSNSFQAVWLGAQRVTGIGTDNVWRWVGGPEGLKDNGNGLPFFKQNGTETVTQTGGTPIGGFYNNWNGGEPNNSGGSGLQSNAESIIQTLGSSGLWNDLPKNSSTLDYYVKETNVADSPLTINAGSGLVTFGGTVGGNKPLSTMTLSTSNAQIDINGGGVYTDNTQSYSVPISMGSNNVTLAVLAGDLITRSGQTYSNDSGGNQILTLSASGNLELTADTQPIANGYKQGLTLIAGNTLTLDSNVNLDSNGGAVLMEANHLSVDAAASVVGGATGSLQIEPYTQGTSMGVGTGAGTLSVDSSYFTSNFINNTFGTVTFGGPTTGLMTVGATPTLIHDKTVFESGGDMTLAADATVNPSGLVGFTLDSVGSTMTENAAAVLNVGSLLLSGNSFYLAGTGAFNLNGTHNTVTTLAAANAASINFVNHGSLIVGTVGNVNVGTTNGVSATGDITLQASGATADLTLDKPVTSTGGNDVLAAGRNFINNNSSNTGIVASGSGKGYFVYSSDPSTTTEAMTGYSKHYNQTYTSGSTPTYASSGNWFLYSIAPVLTENLSPLSVVYGTGNTPAIAATYTGFIDSDVAGTSGISGTTASIASFTASGAGKRPVGSYATTPSPGSLASTLGYSFTAGTGNTLTVTQANATITSFLAADKFFDGNTSATVTSVSGLGGLFSGDTASVVGSVAQFDSSAVGDGKTVTETGVTLGGADGGNYHVTTSGLTALASIKPSSVFIPPVNTTNVVPPPTDTAVQTQPMTPEQQVETLPLVSGNIGIITMSQGPSGGVNQQGVMVTTINSGAPGTGGILATVGDDTSGFKFAIPQNNFGPSNADTFTATLSSGATLPSWLAFDPVSKTFSATDIPPDGLPIVVAVNDEKSGKRLEITISE